MMRADQATSSAGIIWSSCSLVERRSSRVLAERRLSSLARISPARGAHDDPVALADAGGRRDDEHVAVAIERAHSVAGDLEGKNLLLPEIGELDLVPAGTLVRHALLVEQLSRPGLPPCRSAGSWSGASEPAGSTRRRKSSSVAPVARRILEIDSVEGHRSRPSGLVRFDLLKLVASRPALRASPDAVMPWRAANASIAAQTRS